MSKCFTDAEDDSWATRLVFKKLGDERSDDLIHHGDEVGIFSAENNLRLDAGDATCEAGHESWATCFHVKALDGSALRYGTEMGLFSTRDSSRLDIRYASADGVVGPAVESETTRFKLMSAEAPSMIPPPIITVKRAVKASTEVYNVTMAEFSVKVKLEFPGLQPGWRVCHNIHGGVLKEVFGQTYKKSIGESVAYLKGDSEEIIEYSILCTRTDNKPPPLPTVLKVNSGSAVYGCFNVFPNQEPAFGDPNADGEASAGDLDPDMWHQVHDCAPVAGIIHRDSEKPQFLKPTHPAEVRVWVECRGKGRQCRPSPGRQSA